jgi:hypothetical protein
MFSVFMVHVPDLCRSTIVLFNSFSKENILLVFIDLNRFWRPDGVSTACALQFFNLNLIQFSPSNGGMRLRSSRKELELLGVLYFGIAFLQLCSGHFTLARNPMFRAVSSHQFGNSPAVFSGQKCAL